MADNSARIAQIEAILEAGASSVTTDGTTVQYDFQSLRKQLRDLRLSDDTERGSRPIASTIKLSGL